MLQEEKLFVVGKIEKEAINSYLKLLILMLKKFY
jgi:hypothetical protein